MSKEIIVEHKDIANSKTITNVMENIFKATGLNIHKDEVEILEDDHRKGIRRLQVKNTKYFSVGDVPWHKKQPMGL